MKNRHFNKPKTETVWKDAALKKYFDLIASCEQKTKHLQNKLRWRNEEVNVLKACQKGIQLHCQNSFSLSLTYSLEWFWHSRHLFTHTVHVLVLFSGDITASSAEVSVHSSGSSPSIFILSFHKYTPTRPKRSSCSSRTQTTWHRWDEVCSWQTHAPNSCWIQTVNCSRLYCCRRLECNTTEGHRCQVKYKTNYEIR